MPFTAAETVRRGRLGPGELLLVEPGRRAILEDAEAKALGAPRAPDPRRRRGRSTRIGSTAAAGAAHPRAPRARPTTSCATSPASTPSAPGSTSRRWRSKATSRSGAWATTRRRPVAAGSTGRSPTTSARRSPRSPTRPSTPSASGSSWTCGSSSAGARRCSAGRRARRGRCASSGPIVADLDGLLASVRAAGAQVRTLDATWDPTDGAAGLEAALDRLAAEAVAAAAARRRALLVLTDAAWSIDRLPDPVDPGHRRRPHRADRRRPARPDRPRGQRRRHPRRPRDGDGPRRRRDRRPPAPGHRARRRARRHARRRGADPDRDRSAALVAAFEAGLRKTLARMGISAVASYIGGALIDVVELDAGGRRALLPDRGRLARPDDARRPRRAPAPPTRRPPWPSPSPPPGREPRLPDPGFARFRADGEAHLFAPAIAGEIHAPAPVGGPRRHRAAADVDDAAGALPRGARPARRRARRPARRAARSGARAVADPAGRGRGRPLDRRAGSSSRR